MKIKIIATLLGVLIHSSASALVIDITHDGTTYNSSYTGSVAMSIGDTLTYNIISGENDFWLGGGGSFWGGIAAYDDGTRTGDYNWTYSLDGSIVDQGQVLDNDSSAVHVVNFVDGTTSKFDLFSLSYTLTASTSSYTEIQEPFSTFWNDGTPWDYIYIDNPSSVSEPASFALLGLGLAGLILSRKRQAA